MLFLNKSKTPAPDKMTKLLEKVVKQLKFRLPTVQQRGASVSLYSEGVLCCELRLTAKGWMIDTSLDMKIGPVIQLVSALIKAGVQVTYGAPFIVQEDGLVLEGPEAEVYKLARSALDMEAMYPSVEGGH